MKDKNPTLKQFEVTYQPSTDADFEETATVWASSEEDARNQMRHVEIDGRIQSVNPKRTYH